MRRILIAGDASAQVIKAGPAYFHALRSAGGLPAVSFAESPAEAEGYAGAYDALLLPGGNDLPGELFGQPPHAACSYDDRMRDLSDRLLFEAFRSAGKRILGICRGCQAMNVFLGGTLHQHLPDAYSPVLWHNDHMAGRHPVRVAEGTLLADCLGPGEIRVNSSHHQAIDRLGAGLRVSAAAPDGVVEAAEGDGMLLVQWHPERMGEEMLGVFQWVCEKSG